MFLGRHAQPKGLACSFIESAAPSSLSSGYITDGSSMHTEQTQPSTTSELAFVSDSESLNQNRLKWGNLAKMSEWLQVSDMAAAAISDRVLQDLGIETDNDKSYIIDRSFKTSKETRGCRIEIREKEEENFKLANLAYFDRRKDASQNGNYYKSVQIKKSLYSYWENLENSI